MSDAVLNENNHTELCNIYLRHYKKCMSEASVMSRILTGPCDYSKIKMKMCFTDERIEKSKDRKAFKRKLKREREEREQMEMAKNSTITSS